MGLCKLCGENRPFVRAHIIPEAFHRDLRGDSDRPPLLIATHPNSYPKRNPGGLYDDSMLCGRCEERFSWDQYAAECLLQNFEADSQPMSSEEDPLIAYQMHGWDEARLRMFAISLLWRASVTTNEVFRRTKLGPHEARVRNCVLSGNPGNPRDLSVFLIKWTTLPGQQNLTLVQMSPYRHKIDGVNVSRFFLGGFAISVTVDRRPLGSPLDAITLCPAQPVCAIALDFKSSNDWAALRPSVDRYLAWRLSRRC
jgi:hypothetical protein